MNTMNTRFPDWLLLPAIMAQLVACSGEHNTSAIQGSATPSSTSVAAAALTEKTTGAQVLRPASANGAETITTTSATVITAATAHTPSARVEPGTRDPRQWPFAQNSIWNMPIGSEAVYVHAQIERAFERGMTVDEDCIVLTPDLPLINIYLNDADWDKKKDRCEIAPQPIKLFSAPIPESFIVSPSTWSGITPNSGLAVLMPDKRTIRQTQPFAFCDPSKGATAHYLIADQDIYGPGIYGAHGGSGLSAIGGTLRCGELTPTSGAIRHALKVNIYGRKNIYFDTETRGYRWPALRADRYAAQVYYKGRTLEQVKACRMGALLALPASINLDVLGFETQPGRILAETFQNYGAYLVDDTNWDVYAMETEWGPDCRFIDEFKQNWGFSFNEKSKKTGWSRDMDRIFQNLHVVDNNSPAAIGGGGTPSLPLAPPLVEPRN